MSKVLGEAVLDAVTKKYFYVIQTDDGEVLGKSEPVFSTQAEAEAELLEILRGLAQKIGK